MTYSHLIITDIFPPGGIITDGNLLARHSDDDDEDVDDDDEDDDDNDNDDDDQTYKDAGRA